MWLARCVKVSCRRFSCNRARVELYVLIAMGLLVSLAGDAKAQPTYSFTTLDGPGSSLPTSPSANGINNFGQIVGTYSDLTGQYGFLLDNGSYTTRERGSYLTSANGINASSQIVGWYSDDTWGDSHGFLLENGSYTTLDPPGSNFSSANGINASSQIVGSYD